MREWCTGIIHDVRSLYSALRLIPSSTAADTVLIRSHVAYWSGRKVAEAAAIKPYRGHSYSVTIHGTKRIVKIADYYDHRTGVTGWTGSDGAA